MSKRKGRRDMSNSQNDDIKFAWVEKLGQKGEHLFTFDGITIFNLFQDYPYKLTPEQKEIFDAENPFWANFFKSRSNDK